MHSTSITAIESFSEVSLPSGNPQDSLILIDIDDTIFSSCSSWGCVKEFAAMVESEHQAGWTSAQAKIAVYPRWCHSQSTIKTRLIDPHIHQFLKNASTSPVIAFTARQPIVAHITEKQLSRQGINIMELTNFSYEKQYLKPLHPDAMLCAQLRLYANCRTLYQKGILYCHDLNSKGEVFTDFFRAFSEHCKSNNLPIPTKVIFIDDGLHNLHSMYAACTKLDLAYTGYHMQSPSYQFDAKVAKLEEQLGRQRPRSCGF